MQMPNTNGFNITTQRFHDIPRNYIFGVQTSLDYIVNKTKSRKYRISMLADGLQDILVNIPHFKIFRDHFHKIFRPKQLVKLHNGSYIARHTDDVLPPPKFGRVFWYAKTSYYMIFLYAREQDHPSDLINAMFLGDSKSLEFDAVVARAAFRQFAEQDEGWDIPENKEVVIAGVTYGKIYGISTP